MLDNKKLVNELLSSSVWNPNKLQQRRKISIQHCLVVFSGVSLKQENTSVSARAFCAKHARLIRSKRPSTFRWANNCWSRAACLSTRMNDDKGLETTSSEYARSVIWILHFIPGDPIPQVVIVTSKQQPPFVASNLAMPVWDPLDNYSVPFSHSSVQTNMPG